MMDFVSDVVAIFARLLLLVAIVVAAAYAGFFSDMGVPVRIGVGIAALFGLSVFLAATL